MTFGIKHRKLTTWQVLSIGFLIVILTGAFLLSLPISSKNNEWTSYINALFTAGSATCVTGLTVYDTFEHWSVFGQIVILVLIQIGGIGFMTLICMINMILRRKIGVYERKILMQSAGSSSKFSGAVHLVRRILIGTLIFEGSGAVLLAIRFCQDFGFWDGLYNAIFHAVSAFCNAGFDILGRFGTNSSLIPYAGDPLVILTISALIIIGGIGFIVWNDLLEHRFRLKKLQLHSKIVLSATTALIVIPTILIYLFEFQHSFANMSVGDRILASFFQAVTPRTAGFYSVPLEKMTDSSTALMMFLMFIGGSSGSTAGGIKTTTLVVLIAGLISSVRNSGDISVGKRRIEPLLLKQAATTACFYLLAIVLAVITVCAIENLPLKEVLFEVVSAIGTVGLSLGITPTLGTASKLILLLLMYAGRVGLLTLALALGERRTNPPINRPVEKILVG